MNSLFGLIEILNLFQLVFYYLMEDNFLRHVKTSTYMVRANVYVFSPAPEIFMYCVGKRNVRAGSGLYYNGRVIRQKHKLYCS